MDYQPTLAGGVYQVVTQFRFMAEEFVAQNCTTVPLEVVRTATAWAVQEKK